MSKKQTNNHSNNPEHVKEEHLQNATPDRPESDARNSASVQEERDTNEVATAEAEVMSDEQIQQPTPEQNAGTISAEDYEKEIAALKQEAEEFRNRAMRWQAELENYQKRIARQLAEERRYAAIDLIRDLLPVYDNLQRAAQSAEQSHDVAQILQGLRMILKQWEDVLARHHCQKIDALQKPFDPNVHHAISRQATNDVPPNTVICVAQDGFILHDRVVRPSQVVVSMALPTAGSEGSSEAVPSSPGDESPGDHPPS